MTVSSASKRQDQAICPLCAHTAAEGWFGPDLPARFTHCHGCHATFPASNRWGHCARCHRTFSGIQSFDLHQRVTKDGEIAADCLCSQSEPLSGKESTLGEPWGRKWAVGGETLTEQAADWGPYWGRAAPAVFTDPPHHREAGAS